MEQTVYLMTQDQYRSLESKVELILSKLSINTNDNSRTWISSQEAQELLNVGQTTLWQYRKDGKIKASKINRKLYFNRDDIEKMLRGHAT
jgi:hypothetical protein